MEPPPQLELWGGPECTVNRTEERFTDQFLLSGHDERLDDLDRFAELGISAIRYPLLWERIAPCDPDQCDWKWSDERLAKLKSLGMRVMAGLVHHGSGPAYTHLLDDCFATGLARHAARVAERYPWLEDWTPVNEPLTTARFSTLYGFWYPHRRDEAAFWLALLNQLEGVRLAMQAVRLVNPAARLIQTEDLGRTYATEQLRDQERYDNLRRWAGWDLLCGRVDRHHPLWQRIARFGLERRLHGFMDEPLPPDIIGINHYLTSDRFLDHRLQRYPVCSHGGNGRVAYADVEACRVLEPPSQGLEGALREAWQRYGIPMSVTEVHNGCSRDEQMRWMAEAWDSATRLRGEGLDIRAVTAWSLLGSLGWNTLLTAPGAYETGAFEVSSSGTAPRPTAMVSLLKGLQSGAPRHPAVEGKGWWRRPIRLHYPAVRLSDCKPDEACRPASELRPLLICGATGTLGRAFARACHHRDLAFVLTSREDLSLDHQRSIEAALDQYQPWAVINAAGWVRVDDAESDPEGCLRANARGAVMLAQACGERDIPSVLFSSDLVFDGRTDHPYVETDMPSPLNVYGRSKAEAEESVIGLRGNHLIVRTAAFFSPFDSYNFAVAAARTMAAGKMFPAANDQCVSPTYVPHMVDRTLDLAIDGEVGIWHLACDETLSWAAFARQVAAACGVNPKLVRPCSGADLGWRAARPAFSGLGTARSGTMSSLAGALQQFSAQL